MKIISLIPFCLLLPGLLFADAENEEALVEFPRISSSTSYQPILMQLVQKHLGLEVVEGRPVHPAGERFYRTAKADDPRWSVQDARGISLLERVRHHQTHGAGLKVIDGSVDMAIIPAPGPELMAAAEEAGVELTATPIATEALVFLVSLHTPAQKASTERLRELYAGKPATWQELDPDTSVDKVVPFVRDPTSGSHVLFRSLLMGDTPVAETLRLHQTIGGMGPMLDSVADHPRTLGYSIFTYHQGMARVEIEPEQEKAKSFPAYSWRKPTRLLALDGVPPTRETIGNGTYPLRAPIVALTRADLPEQHRARQLVKWMTSDEGQNWIEEIGFPRAEK